MAGRKGMKGEHLGGARPNAGRPVRGARVEVDQSFVVWQTDIDGQPVGLAQKWTLVDVTRKHLIYVSDNGDKFRMEKIMNIKTGNAWVSVQNTGKRRVQVVYRTEVVGGRGYDIPIYVGEDAKEFVASYTGNDRHITAEERRKGKAALSAAFK